MAFPQVQSSASGNSGANSTTHSITLPSGITAGDLVIVFFSNDDAATASVTTPASGWEGPIGQGVSPSNSNRLSVFWRFCDGTEGATITITLTSTNGAAWTTYRISGCDSTTDPEISATASGTSTSPDPSSLSPSWGADDTLWFAVYGWDGNVAHSSYPTNYSSNQLTDRWANVAGAGIASASRNLNASSEDPGAGAIASSDQWVAYTVAIRPQGSAVNLDVDNTFAFTETLDLTSFEVDNTFTFGNVAEHNYFFEDCDNVLVLDSEATLATFTLLAANRLFFFGAFGEEGQEVEHNYFFYDVENEFSFDSVTGYNQELSITQYLGFTDRYFVPAFGNAIGLTDSVRRAYAVTAENLFDWNDHSDDPAEALFRAYNASNDLGFVITISASNFQELYQYLELEDDVDSSDTEYGRPSAQSVVKQHLTFKISGTTCPEKEYTPFIGSSGDTSFPEVSATPPTLGSGVFTLTYPRVSPTTTLVLKNPTFGNTDTLRFAKIDRRTRGGDRKIFSDLDWSETQTLELTIENLCATEVTIDELLAFLNASLGKLIGLLDWENRQWEGVIVAPETEVIPTVSGHRIRIVFEGELA